MFVVVHVGVELFSSDMAQMSVVSECFTALDAVFKSISRYS